MNASPQTHSSPVDENGHLASGSTERTSFWTAVDLVAGREMKVKMMSKAFVVTTGDRARAAHAGWAFGSALGRSL